MKKFLMIVAALLVTFAALDYFYYYDGRMYLPEKAKQPIFPRRKANCFITIMAMVLRYSISAV